METVRRYFYQDGFTQNWFQLLNFLSNWKTMFWVISQEQHSIKTLLKLRAICIASLMKKTYLAVSSSYQWVGRFFYEFLADRKAVDSTPKHYLLAWDIIQAPIFSLCIRYKWVNSIDWSIKLFLIRQGLIYKTPVFYLFHRGNNWKVQPRATPKIPVVNLCVNWGK